MGAKTRNTRRASDGPKYALIPLDQIEPDPALSRYTIDRDRLCDLARSIEQQGQVAPIVVRRLAGRGKLLIISGERRWMAARLSTRVRSLACLIYDDMSEADARLLRLAEDLAREDVPLLELGEMVDRVLKARDWSLRRLARELGVKIHRLRRPFTLLRLPPAVQNMVRLGELKQSHALAVTQAPPGERHSIAERVVREELTHEQTVALVNRRRAALGMATHKQPNRYKFTAPGGCKVVVVTPTGTGRSVVRQALVAVLARLLAPKRPVGTDV